MIRASALLAAVTLLTACARWPNEGELAAALDECGFAYHRITQQDDGVQSPIQYHFHSDEPALAAKQNCLRESLKARAFEVPLGLGQLKGSAMVQPRPTQTSDPAPPMVRPEVAQR